jgi:3-carboxy-cis,cis-muconate cycloisomerase
MMLSAAPTLLEARLLNWALPLQRCREHLNARANSALTLQLAGAVGDGAAWGAQAVALRKAVAQRLSLPLHPWAWHAQRDEGARLAAELGVLVGALAKVGLDVALMSQAEVDELQESAAVGRGSSSAMPHKRNPVGAMVALSAVQRAPQRVAAVIASMASPHERGLGQWQAEGAELAELLVMTAAAASAMVEALEQALVKPGNMWDNLQAFHQAFGVPLRADDAQASSLDLQRQHCWMDLERVVST